jgi:hypothetical protein
MLAGKQEPNEKNALSMYHPSIHGGGFVSSGWLCKRREKLCTAVPHPSTHIHFDDLSILTPLLYIIAVVWVIVGMFSMSRAKNVSQILV